jgi:hypothetical protein
MPDLCVAAPPIRQRQTSSVWVGSRVATIPDRRGPVLVDALV